MLLGNESRIGYWIEQYDFESEQAKKAKAEMMSYSEEMKFHEYFVTDIPKINEYLINENEFALFADSFFIRIIYVSFTLKSSVSVLKMCILADS